MRKRHATIAIISMGLLATCSGIAQDIGSWGFQGDFGVARVPQFLIEKVRHDFPEIPSVKGSNFSAGLTYFNARKTPSFGISYVSTQLDLTGESSYGETFRARVKGAGAIKGVIVTKYVNFVVKKRVSGGLALGGGIGKLDGSYARDTMDPGTGKWILTDQKSVTGTIPTFEILGRIDIRVARFVTVGPYAGLRNGPFAAGLAAKLHF